MGRRPLRAAVEVEVPVEPIIEHQGGRLVVAAALRRACVRAGDRSVAVLRGVVVRAQYIDRRGSGIPRAGPGNLQDLRVREAGIVGNDAISADDLSPRRQRRAGISVLDMLIAERQLRSSGIILGETSVAQVV